MRLLLLPVLLLSFGIAEADAETFHVAQSFSASDDNLGTMERPWSTISRAARTLEPGDTVVIHGGVYRECVKPARGGSQSQPICYVAAEGENVVISGADSITGWTPTGNGIWKKMPWTCRFPTHPDNDFHRLIGRCEQVIADGQLLKQVATPSELEPGAFCAMPDEKTLYVRLEDDADPNEQVLQASVRSLCFGLGWGDQPVDHIHVQGLTIRYAANKAQYGALYAKGAHWQIEDCSAEWTNGAGMSFNGNEVTLRRVRAHHNGQQGLRGSGRGFLLEEVVLNHNNLKGFDKGWEAGGMKITHARSGVLRRCRAEANDGNGLWFDIDVRDVVVEDCLVADNAQSGIFVEISGGFEIRNNLCLRNGLDGNWGRGGITIGESNDCTIEYNTCVGNASGVSIREQGPRTFPGIDGARVSHHVHDLQIRRNILAFNTRCQVAYWYDNRFFGPHPSGKDKADDEVYDPDNASIFLDHNLYACRERQQLALYGAPWRSRHRKYTGLSAWQKDRGQDRDSVVGDPMFVDPDTDDWHVKPGSPALPIKAGRVEY